MVDYKIVRDRALQNLSLTGAEWSRTMPKIRNYFDLLGRVKKDIPEGFRIDQYGSVSYDQTRFPLIRVLPEDWDDSKPSIIVSAGVHGSEPAGVEGLLISMKTLFPQYADKFNLVAYPCLNPSGYEIDSRWNFIEQDLNRNFGDEGAEDVEECELFTASVQGLIANGPLVDVIDLHENLRVGVLEMDRQAARAGTKSNWTDLAPGYFIYECVLREDWRIGPEVIEPAGKIIPVCPLTEMAGDQIDNGVSYWPSDVNTGSDYTNATSTESHLLMQGTTAHGFTLESPEIWVHEDGTVENFGVEQRAQAHAACVDAIFAKRVIFQPC